MECGFVWNWGKFSGINVFSVVGNNQGHKLRAQCHYLITTCCVLTLYQLMPWFFCYFVKYSVCVCERERDRVSFILHFYAGSTRQAASREAWSYI
jgi:hypothetical protein